MPAKNRRAVIANPQARAARSKAARLREAGADAREHEAQDAPAVDEARPGSFGPAVQADTGASRHATPAYPPAAVAIPVEGDGDGTFGIPLEIGGERKAEQRIAGPRERIADLPIERAPGERTVDPELVAAFREVHQRRLHGFALLLTLGDRRRARELTEGALRAAEPRVAELTHPERAAAWLRRQLTKDADRSGVGGRWWRVLGGKPKPGAADGLPEIGATKATLDGLAVLNLTDRAVLILHEVEGFRQADVADALETGRTALEERLRRARSKYARAYADAVAGNGADRPHLPDAIRGEVDAAFGRRKR